VTVVYSNNSNDINDLYSVVTLESSVVYSDQTSNNSSDINDL